MSDEKTDISVNEENVPDEPDDILLKVMQIRNKYQLQNQKLKRKANETVEKYRKYEVVDKDSLSSVAEKLKERNESIAKEIVEVKASVKTLNKETERCEKLKAELCSKAEEPRNRQEEYRLLYKITKLNFDMNCLPDELKGITTRDSVKSFHLNTSQHSQFFITNHLWSLLDSEDK